MMNLGVISALMILTLIGIAVVHHLAGRPKHKWLGPSVHRPLVTQTGGWDENTWPTVAIEADITATGTFNISALPSRV